MDYLFAIRNLFELTLVLREPVRRTAGRAGT